MHSLRLGLFGGTFDPPHLGHLVVAQDVAHQLFLDRLIFVVAGHPPHKTNEVLSSPLHRVEMTRAAVADNPLFEVSEVELSRSGPTYTVDTLRHFREAYPEADLFFLLGADQLAEFHEWHEPEEIARLATVVAVSRNGTDPALVKPVALATGRDLDFIALPVTRLDISSSDIRARVREGGSVRYLVPEGVRTLMDTHRLYRSMS